jgi:hypothetical protein
MSTSTNQSNLVGRRAELIAELFLQDLDPKFISRPTSPEIGYDLLVGFHNDKGGTNTFAIQVKSTEQSSPSRYVINRNVFNRMIHSNVPTLLLVADVKQNSLCYAWLKSSNGIKGQRTVSVQLTPVNVVSKKELYKQLTRSNHAVAAAG